MFPLDSLLILSRSIAKGAFNARWSLQYPRCRSPWLLPIDRDIKRRDAWKKQAAVSFRQQVMAPCFVGIDRAHLRA